MTSMKRRRRKGKKKPTTGVFNVHRAPPVRTHQEETSNLTITKQGRKIKSFLGLSRRAREGGEADFGASTIVGPDIISPAGVGMKGETEGAKGRGG